MKKSMMISMLCVLLTSCYISKSTYTNATMGSTNGYVVKPEYIGQNKSAIYVSAEFGNSNVSSNGNTEEASSKTFGGLNFHRAHTTKNFNAYYGVGGQFGRFKFPVDDFQSLGSGDLISAGSKNFYAVQAKTGINYLVSKPYADFRVLGIDLGYTYEFGPYFDTLGEIETGFVANDVEVFRKSSAYYLGLNSEIVFKINTKNSIGINPFAGKSFLESKNGLNPNLYGLNLSYRYSNFALSFFNELNSQYNVDAYSCKLGLTYRIN